MFCKKAIAFLSILVLDLACQTEPAQRQFNKLSPEESGITFQNTLKESDDFNILDYLYFYDGGGVAAGDINNDGLTDLFFVSNQGENKLYLNKGLENGKPQFEDISETAQIAGFSEWQTGVSMADINGDGLLDIYVCAVSKYLGLQGNNELYINNGDLTFTEQSHQYGLDFSGFSTQSAFFDYDKDGDLDCYLLNHAVHNTRSYDRVNTRTLKDNEAGDILFENIGGKFVDASQKTGIYQAAMGYGLGLAVADINNDGWEDIYVSNDFHEDDYYYINQKDGTFKEEIKSHFKHLSRSSMGSDVADINNDGYFDIITLDMYPEDESVEKSTVGEDPLDVYLYKLEFGYYNQYSRNCLQLNLGGEKFSDIALMAGVAATDWSWSPLMADFDNDGQKDIFITNGILRRPNDLDYLQFVLSDSLHYNVLTSLSLEQKAIEMMPDGKWHNYFYRNTGNLQFEDLSHDWGFGEKNCSNGSVYADLDNDGDLDLITNDINAPAGIYLNQGTPNNYIQLQFKGEKENTFGIGTKVVLFSDSSTQVAQLMPTRGFLSSVEPKLHFGLGQSQKIDSLWVIWESQKTEVVYNPQINQLLNLDEQNAVEHIRTWPLRENKMLFEEEDSPKGIDFVHKENTYYDFNRELLMPFKLSIEGPKIAVADVNGDGLDDFFVCGAKYQSGMLYLQKSKGSFEPNNVDLFANDAASEDVYALFFDADGDNDLDLYVVSGGNEYFDQMRQLKDRFYRNTGNGNFVKDDSALPEMFENKAFVKAADFDKDGDLDLVVGSRVMAKQYGKTPRSFLLQNDGKGHFTDVTEQMAPELRLAGMLTDAQWVDVDHDGWLDLNICGDWMPVKTFINHKGKLEPRENGLEKYTGLWQSLLAYDFDQDGDIDLIGGNLGTNTKLLKEKNGTLRMYLKDIDRNGSTEQIVAYSKSGHYFPANVLAEMASQMPEIFTKKHKKTKDFAGKDIETLFDDGELDGADMKEVNTFASQYFENDGQGHFTAHKLPQLAQVSKIMTLQTEDVDNDGKMDVLIGGNFEGASMYQSRYDASFGLILRNLGAGQFSAVLPTDSGLLLDGDIRDLEKIRIQNKIYWIAARNNQSLQFFQSTQPLAK
ncbi:VCBS repeat-containing protein [Marinilongibacter aquaticus]|uniref:VCBS repeat-containing protein n=1 Tax=Marinilongibacter aquaticus TaxID=2975157 RepID=UPI0021BD0A29|nr:VCBS repeat-containing protein [Marinilongibacter aquaticus]UBM57750.1 VCBS repeat-containing protein [Marinilongibacter aquaticus]